MGISIDHQQPTSPTPCCRTLQHHQNQNEDHHHRAVAGVPCSCRKQVSTSSRNQRNHGWKVRPFHHHTSWLNMSLIILALVLPLILESNLSSCSPIPGTNEQAYYHSKYLSPSYRQHQQQQQQQLQQQFNPSHQHHQIRSQRHSYRPLNDNMETSLDSSSSLSIVSPLDILRQNLLLEIHRQRLRLAKTKQVESNREFLEKIG